MAYFVNTDPGVLAGRAEIEPSARLSFAGAVGSAVTGNISSVIADYAELQRANQGPRLTQEAANQRFKDAGVKHSAPVGGYTESAADILIKRQRNQQLMREIDAATPYSWVGTPVRGGAMLLAGLSDPLNVASAFIPVVREARAASMLAGRSGLAAAGARAQIGALEGAVGAAVVEAPTYGLRTALQDDYSLTDSLVNMAFGTALGGGLHAAGGAIGDQFSGGVNPYSRFAGLGTKEIRQVLDYEAGRASADAFTPAQRRAAGLVGNADTVPVAAVEQRIIQPVDPVRSSPSVERPRADLSQVADAPFARLYELTPEAAQTRALLSARDEFRAELLAQASGRAEPRVIADTRRQMADLQQRRERLEAEIAKLPSPVRKQLDAETSNRLNSELRDVIALQERGQSVIDNNTRAAKAEQDIARAITGVGEPPASFVIGMAQPETREAAMRTALADFADGRMPNVEAVVRSDPGVIGNRSTPQQLADAARARGNPDSAYLGSREASEAAATKEREGSLEIEKELEADLQRLDNLIKNLEANGIPRESLEKLADLAAFDDEVKRAKTIGEVSRIAAICGIRQ